MSCLIHLAFGPYPKGVTESELTFDTLDEHLFDCQGRSGRTDVWFWHYSKLWWVEHQFGGFGRMSPTKADGTQSASMTRAQSKVMSGSKTGTQFGDLSERQVQVLTFIKEKVSERGYPPSVREIGEALGLSPSTVHSPLRPRQGRLFVATLPSLEPSKSSIQPAPGLASKTTAKPPAGRALLDGCSRSPSSYRGRRGPNHSRLPGWTGPVCMIKAK